MGWVLKANNALMVTVLVHVAVCDGFFFRGKEVSIVGAGDTACEEALYLSKLATTVHMIVRKDEDGMRASKVMQDRVKNTANIKVYWNSETLEVLGETKTQGVRIKNNKTVRSNHICKRIFCCDWSSAKQWHF
jgi:thioredoxin reductase (NADPH)